MAEEVKISELESLTSLTGTEQIPASLDNDTYRISPNTLKEFATKELSEKVNEVEQKANGAVADVATLSSKTLTLSQNVEKVTQDVSEQGTSISALETKTKAVEDDLKVTNNSLSKVEKRVSANELDIQTITGNIAVLSAEQAKQKGRIDDCEEKIEELGSTISGAVKEELEKLEGEIATNTALIEENKGKIATNTTDIASLNTSVEKAGEDAATAKEAAGTAATQAGEAIEAARAAKESAESVVGDITSIRSALTALQQADAQIKESIEELDDNKQDNLSAGKGIQIKNNIVSCTYQGDNMLTGSFSPVSGTTTNELTPDADDTIVEALGKLYSAIRRNEEVIAAALIQIDHRLCKIENEIF